MNVRVSLNGLVARVAMMCAVLGLSAWLLAVVASHYVVDALSDERIPISAMAGPASFILAPLTDKRIGVNPGVLAAAVDYLPHSPRLQLRLAAFESGQFQEDWSGDQVHALRAIQLSPRDYRPRLLLAAIQESREDFQGAEETVRTVLKLAPNCLEAHWQLATLLLRRKELAQSFVEFRIAGSGNAAYFQAAMDMVWSEAGEKAAAVMAITPDNTKDSLGLARFLLQKGRPEDSAAVFRQIGGNAFLDVRESGLYLDSLIAAGHVALAHELWRPLAARGGEPPSNVIWNSGFESDILLNLSQFDWSIVPNAYARISIDNLGTGANTVHSGRRSLRVDFLGRDTTRLQEEIQQLALVRPGARYRLRYYVRTENLVAPEGPRIVLSVPASSPLPGTTDKIIAASYPAPPGSSDWQRRELEFAAAGPALVVSIEQRPKFSFEDATRGTVWFDDFEIQEIHER